jgi:hypothetical protein
MRCLVLSNLSIKIVRRKERIDVGSGKRRIDPQVYNPMLLVLVPEQPMSHEGTFILQLLVGNDDQGLVWSRRTISFEFIQKLGEGSFEGSELKVQVAIELIAMNLLGWIHASRSAQIRMGEGEDVTRVRTYRDRDIVGEVLGSVETNETVNTDIFMAGGQRTEFRMGSNGLAGEAIGAIKDRAW